MDIAINRGRGFIQQAIEKQMRSDFFVDIFGDLVGFQKKLSCETRRQAIQPWQLSKHQPVLNLYAFYFREDMNDHDIWTHKSVQRARYGEERSIPIQFINQPVDLYNVIEDKRNHRNYEDLESEYYEKLPDVVTKPQFSENTTVGLRRRPPSIQQSFKKSSSLDSPPLPPMASTLQRLYYPSGKGSTVSIINNFI